MSAGLPPYLERPTRPPSRRRCSAVRVHHQDSKWLRAGPSEVRESGGDTESDRQTRMMETTPTRILKFNQLFYSH